MRQFIQKMALVTLMLTLVTACQKEEVANIQPDDQITLRTLNFDLETLQIIHDALLAEVNELGANGTLTPQQKNYLINLLKKMQKAIDQGDEEEANLILEDDFLDYLETLLDGGVIDQDQFDGLEGIATNQTEPTEGTVTYGDFSYNWKVMADGKKWLVQNLRHDAEGYTSDFYPTSLYPEGIDPVTGPDLFGRMYTNAAASAACASLGDGWRLPSMIEWQELGSAYGGTWDELEPDILANWEAGNYLVADLFGWNDTELAVGFDALYGGQGINESFYYFGITGDYASSTMSSEDPVSYWYARFFSENNFTGGIPARTVVLLSYSDLLASCRCVHD